MTITFRDYVMETDTFGGFHLRKNVLRNKTEIVDGKKVETGEVYEDLDTLGYNMRLETCLKRIIHLEMDANKETKTLREAMEFVKNMYAEIEQSIKL